MKKYIGGIILAMLLIYGISQVAYDYQLGFIQEIIPIIAIIIGIIPNIIYIYYNEKVQRKFEIDKRILERKYELYKMREATYRALIKGMRGFYVDGSKEMKELFLYNLRIS